MISANYYRHFAIKTANPVLMNALIFFCFGVTAVISRWVTMALFTQAMGANALPFILSINSVIHFLIALFISMYFSKFAVLRFVRWTVFICFGILLLSTLFLTADFSIKYSSFVLIIAGSRISSIIEMLMWICAAQFFSGRHAKRAYATLVAANSAGLIVGGCLLSFLSTTLSPLYLMLISCAALLFAFFIILILEKKSWHPNFTEIDATEPFTKFTNYIFRSSTWWKLLLIAVCIYGFYYLSQFQFVLATQKNFSGVSEITRFFGYFEIVSSIIIVPFAFFSAYLIRVFGVWNASVFALFMIFGSFIILAITGDNIYAASFSRIINTLFFKMSLIVIGIICKHAKEKYLSVVISFFDFIPVSFGTLAASILGLLITYHILTFSQFSLLIALIALSMLIWMLSNKLTYIRILVSGIENDEYLLLKKASEKNVFSFISFNNLYEAINKNIKNTRSIKLIVYDMQFKITNIKIIKILFQLLESIHDDDPRVRKKSLTALIYFSNLKFLLVPYILECVKDDDIEVCAQAIITLHHFDAVMAKERSDEILNRLFKIDDTKFQIVYLKLISTLQLNRYNNIVIAAMDNNDENVREAAYQAFGNISEIDNDESIDLLIKHLNEQNYKASQTLLTTISKLVISKKYKFYECIFNADLHTWRNSVDLLMRWKCHTEYEMIILTGMNKVHLLYENIISIDQILHVNNRFADIVAQHIIYQNEVIIKGVVSITAINSYDPLLIDKIYKELKSSSKNVRGTALELIENLGEKRLTKHLSAYLNANNKERIAYAKRVWHSETEPLLGTFKSLLDQKDPWIKACVIRLLLFIDIPQGISLLKGLVLAESNIFVKSYAQNILNKLTGDICMKANKKVEIDHLDIVVFLKQTALFKEVHFNTLVMVSKSLIQQYFKKGDTIFKAGDDSKGMHLIYQGTIISNPLKSDSINELEFGAGSVIGAQYMLNDSYALETVIAKDDVIALFLPKSLYKNLVVLHPEVAVGLLNEISTYHCKMLAHYQRSLKTQIK